MKGTIFEGAGVAIITPMKDDGSVNYAELGNIVEDQIAKHTDAIIVCGTTGESATMDTREHIKVIKYVCDAVNGRIPVIAGAGSNDTSYGVDLAKEATDCGADALLVVTPYYNKTSQAGLINHYNYIADRVTRPIIVYNVPSRTGLNILPQTYVQLGKHPMIWGVKEANGNVSALAESISLCSDSLTFYSGNDDQITSFMSLGAKGVISVLSNVCPQETHDIAQAALDGDFKKSAQLQLKYLELCNKLFSDVNPIPVKAAMNMIGWNVGECRMPLYKMSEEKEKALRECLVRYGLVK